MYKLDVMLPKLVSELTFTELSFCFPHSTYRTAKKRPHPVLNEKLVFVPYLG